MTVTIWCDGAATPNGGPAGAGYVIVGNVMHLGSDALGRATNNVAEYTAVLNALRYAADRGATRALVRMDSAIVLGQLRRTMKCRVEHLVALRDAVLEEKGRFPGGVTLQLIPREKNAVADALARLGAASSKTMQSGETA